MSKWILVALAGLLLVPLFVGCDAVSPEVKTLQGQMAALIDWKAQAAADINTAKTTAGALSGQVNSATSDVASLRSQIANLPANNSYTKADVYTKAEVDKAITDAIAAHVKATPAVNPYNPINPINPNPNPGNNLTGGTTVSGGNGSVTIQQYGYAQPLVTSGSTPTSGVFTAPISGVVSQSYSMVLTCPTAQQPQLFIPTITITPAYGNGSSAIVYYCYVTSSNGNSSNPITFTYPSNIYTGNNVAGSLISPSASLATAATQILMVNAASGGYNGGGNIFIVPGNSQVFITFTVSLASSVGVPWNVQIGGISVNAYNTW